MTPSRKVRLAYSGDLMLTFTPRGRTYDRYIYGFIRLQGRTVSGYVYEGLSGEVAFFPTGIHQPWAYEVARANRQIWREALNAPIQRAA
jgi:hypothetical protein